MSGWNAPGAGSSPTLTPDSFVLSMVLVVLTTRSGQGKGSSEVVSRAQGIGVAVAQLPALAGEGFLAELASPLILPQLPQDGDEDKGREQGVGMVGSRRRRTPPASADRQLAQLQPLPRSAVRPARASLAGRGPLSGRSSGTRRRSRTSGRPHRSARHRGDCPSPECHPTATVDILRGGD